MATKTEIEANITSQLTGNAGVTTRSAHESLLKTETASILENIYAPVVLDDTSGTLTITQDNANFIYDVTFSKVGRTINIFGSFRNISGSVLSGGSVVFDILPGQTEFLSTENTNAIAQKIGASDEVISISLSNSQLLILNNVLSTEKFQFNFNYNSSN